MIVRVFSVLCISISCVFLKFFFLPYAWISALWLIFLIYMLSIIKSPWKKSLFLNLSIFTSLFGYYEVHLFLSDKNRIEYEENYAIIHDFLGSVPQKNRTSVSTRYHNSEVIHKSTYTIDSNGLRISPPYQSADTIECILFFGGSFTFGEGVGDTETMPYQTGMKLDGAYRIYNFSFYGYGPHQMLSSIEHGIIGEILTCRPKYIIYQAIFEGSLPSLRPSYKFENR